jgi:hypothetical protein
MRRHIEKALTWVGDWVEVGYYTTIRMDLWHEAGAKFIHVVRHPHHVAKSMYKVGMDPYDRALLLWLKVQIEVQRWPLAATFNVEDLWLGHLETWASFIGHLDLEPWESVDGPSIVQLSKRVVDEWEHMPDVKQEQKLPDAVKQQALELGYAVHQ